LSQIQNKAFFLFDYTTILYRHKLKTRAAFRKIAKYRKTPKISTLFIVGTIWNIEKTQILDIPKNIKYKKRFISTDGTEVISLDFFAKIIGLKGKFLELFNDLILYHKQGNLKALSTIVNLLETEQISILTTSRLEFFLKQEGIIQKHLSELFNPDLDFTTLDEFITKNKDN